MSTSIMFNGKEVRNPITKILVAVLVIIFVIIILATLGFVMITVILGTIALAFVLTVPLHLIFRLCGRRGFYVREGNSHTWTSTGAFERR